MALQELIPAVGIAAACSALGVPRASFYRSQKPRDAAKPRSPPPRALSDDERANVRDVLNSERFVDVAPAAAFAMLLDEGTYLCSTRTMYRILDAANEVRERRDQARRPTYEKPELLAEAPNQVWSWDITRLRGPAKWSYFQLYTIIDIHSRYVVGWLIADCESEQLARDLIEQTCEKQGIAPGTLTLHADRGSSMTSHTVAQLLIDLDVRKTHSRPHVSDDNPFSESQFKTMKYRPEFPDRFTDIQHARTFARAFFQWYNHEHRHSGIGMMTPDAVHHGRVETINETRQATLSAAFRAHPERFVRRPPTPPRVPTAVWINPPSTEPSQG
jgi:putative transposase